MSHLPLKITFTVSGGFVPPPYPFHLDGLLAYSATMRALDDIQGEPSKEALRELGEHLPLSRYEQDGEWVWMASALTLTGPTMNDSRFYTQRRDKVDYCEGVRDGSIQHGRHRPGSEFAPYQFQIDTLRGIHRNLLGYYPVQRSFSESSLQTVVAWCVGDKDLIEELLMDDRAPTHLGSRRRMGHGRIESITVEEDSAATGNWRNRVRPWPLCDGDIPIQAAVRPPYWAAENRMSAFIPGGL